MLPPRLSTDLCSLVGGQDRLAFSVFWEMDREARVLRTWFAKVLMCSVAALSYGQAQEMLDSEREDPMARGVKTLNALAKKLRQRRLEAGALTLANTEVKFLLDKESQKPMDLEMYQLKEANSLVEELMLLANVAVARHILQHFPKSALLRRHPVPPPARFESLVRAARTKGIEVKVDTSRQLADSLDAAQIPGYPYFNKLLRILTTRCLTEAVYFSAGQVEPDKYWHYGLACDTYTHFTSPIRRYADLVVHRMLACSLGLAAPSPALADSKAVATLCEHINHRDRMAALAGRASVDLYTLIFFGARGRVEDEALVVAMRADGVRVLVPRFGIEHFLRVVPREDEDDASALDVARAKAAVRFDEETLTLTTPQRVYKIFDRLRVVIYVHESKMRRRTLRVDLADAAPPAAAAATASAATPTRVSMPKRPSSAAAAPAAKGAKRPRHAASGARATGAMRDEDGDEEEEEEEKDKEEEGGGDESESDGESGTASDSGARADDELARRPAAKRGPQRQQKRRGAAV
jgi:exosome complex exonuclease DIS3/RRP44